MVTRAKGQEEDQKTLWEKVKQGTHIIFQDKDWEEGVVHIGEVLRVDRLGDSIDVWYNLQNKRGQYDWHSPMIKGTYTPEHCSHRGETVVAPKASEITDLAVAADV